MNREEYLNQLKKYLRRLPSDDYENAMEYFTEYFDEAGPEGEAQAIKDLGSPKEAAAEMLSALLNEKISLLPDTFDAQKQQGRNRRYRAGDPIPRSEKKSSFSSVILIAFLTICAAPIAAPLAIVAIALFLAGIITLGTIILCVFMFSLSGTVLGVFTLVKSFTAITASLPGFCLIFGCGLLSIGFAILLFIAGVYICKWIGIGLIRFTQWLTRKRRVN